MQKAEFLMESFLEFINESYFKTKDFTPENICKSLNPWVPGKLYEIVIETPERKKITIIAKRERGSLVVKSYKPMLDDVGGLYIKVVEMRSTDCKSWKPAKSYLINSIGNMSDIMDFLIRTKNPFLTKEILDTWKSYA